MLLGLSLTTAWLRIDVQRGDQTQKWGPERDTHPHDRLRIRTAPQPTAETVDLLRLWYVRVISFPPREDKSGTNAPRGGGLVVNADDGDAYWWLGTLSVNKIDGAASGGSVDIVEHTVPAGYAPPTHVHRDQDEVFYVLDGEFRVHCGPDEFLARPGALVYLPKGVPHGFEMTSR